MTTPHPTPEDIDTAREIVLGSTWSKNELIGLIAVVLCAERRATFGRALEIVHKVMLPTYPAAKKVLCETIEAEMNK